MYLIETISAVATSLKLNYVPLSITSGVLLLDEGTTREERVSFATVVDNADGTATYGDLRRGLAYGGGTAYAAAGTTAYEHTGNSCTARLVVAHEFFNKMVVTDRASLIASGVELQFGATSQAVYGNGTELFFKSSTTAAKSLAQLAALSGSDEKVKVSIDDTTAGYLLSKLAAGTGIKLTELSPAGDEDAEIGISDLFKLQSDNEKTIATGAITVTSSVTRVDTESDASSDDLDTISGGTENMIIIIRAEHTDRTVVVKHNTGNILLAGGSDVTLDDSTKRIVLQYDDNLSKWVELAKQVDTSAFLTSSSSPVYTLGVVTAASASVGSSSTAETAMAPTWTGTPTVPVNALAAGAVVRIEIGGLHRIDDVGSGGMEISVYLGSKIVGCFYRVTTTTASKQWSGFVEIDVRTGGATGTFFASGLVMFNTDSTTSIPHVALGADAAGNIAEQSSVDFTGTLLVAVKAQFLTSHANHACSITTGRITIHRPPA
ncbi:hypothetical protein KW797_00040 [Candidatus Parcubacteria bacterium]|nr:hypothetical protein [Candidatus Parcubacteria bacterium]